MKTLEQLARDALDVQDACNLSGVVHAFSNVMTALREHARAGNWENTDKLNHHPIAIMWASKIASLTGCENGLAFSMSYDWCFGKANHNLRIDER
jgi:hypothetical protein